MKRTYLSLALVFLLIAAVLAGCGSASGGSSSAVAEDAYDAPAAYAYDDYGYEDYEYDGYWAEESAMSAPAPMPSSSGVPAAQPTKIIYTAAIEMETLEFDDAVKAIAALAEACGGYYESSSMSERSNSLRYATYTVRVPAERYREFVDEAGTLCHVLRSNEYTEDVSEYYYDTAGRLETQKTKLERLQALLAEAEDMEDIIVLENAISETEELIDRLSGELRHYDALVDYSTVTIELSEVRRIVEEPMDEPTFWERIGTAFKEGLEAFGEGLEVIAVVLLYIWPWLLLIGGVVVLIVFLARRGRKRRLAKRGARLAAAQTPQQPMEQRGPNTKQ